MLAAIDAANSADPTLVQAEGRLVPAELLYGERMSAALAEFMPDASEALTIAARGQHVSAGRRRAPTTRQDASDI